MRTTTKPKPTTVVAVTVTITELADGSDGECRLQYEFEQLEAAAGEHIYSILSHISHAASLRNAYLDARDRAKSIERDWIDTRDNAASGIRLQQGGPHTDFGPDSIPF